VSKFIEIYHFLSRAHSALAVDQELIAARANRAKPIDPGHDRRGIADMKASFLVAAAAAAALSIVTTTAPSLADDDGRGCSNASLSGRYGLATHGDFVGVYGTGTPPVIQFFAAPVRVDEVTTETFDGHGNATQSEYVFLNGSDATSGFVGGATGTYQVQQDCTGTEMLTYGSPPNGFEIDRAFVLSNGGRTIHILTTKIHTPFPLPEFPAGVCSKGCDVAIQLYADGERQ
jgi:hypothetical protein